jgi:uncharacterized protein (TIGR02246 family)
MKRRAAWFLLTLVTLTAPAWAQPGRKGTMRSDEEAIIAETQAFATAWNAADARAAAAFYAEDGARVGAMGDVQHGRREIEVAYDKLLHGPFAGAVVTQERGSVRMLGPDLAVWQAGIQIQPAHGPLMKGHIVQVMKKIGGRWLIVEAHPKLFPPPPPATK